MGEQGAVAVLASLFRGTDVTIEAPARREPIFTMPGAVLVTILVLVAIHALRDFGLDDATDVRLLSALAFVPARLTFLFDPGPVVDALARLPGAAGIEPEELRALVEAGGIHPWSLLTYALLHANWMHVAVNTIWLAAFGAPAVRRLGSARYVILLAVTAIAGALLHWLTHPVDIAPVIGASAAVSGVMGFAVRFVFQPGAPLGPALPRHPPQFDPATGDYIPPPPADPQAPYRRPALPLTGLPREGRALGCIAIWFGVNFVFGILSQPLGMTEQGVAWEAHVGGFLAGLLLFFFFDRRVVQSLPSTEP